jgi:hypothetical protein
MAPGSCTRRELWKREYPHIPKNPKLSRPNNPEGIFDMIGPNTLEGGYSSSQYMSSTMFKAVVVVDVVVVNCALGTKAATEEGVLILEDEEGTNADTAAIMAARKMRVSLAIFEIRCE